MNEHLLFHEQMAVPQISIKLVSIKNLMLNPFQLKLFKNKATSLG